MHGQVAFPHLRDNCTGVPVPLSFQSQLVQKNRPEADDRIRGGSKESINMHGSSQRKARHKKYKDSPKTETHLGNASYSFVTYKSEALNLC